MCCSYFRDAPVTDDFTKYVDLVLFIKRRNRYPGWTETVLVQLQKTPRRSSLALKPCSVHIKLLVWVLPSDMHWIMWWMLLDKLEVWNILTQEYMGGPVNISKKGTTKPLEKRKCNG